MWNLCWGVCRAIPLQAATSDNLKRTLPETKNPAAKNRMVKRSAPARVFPQPPCPRRQYSQKIKKAGPNRSFRETFLSMTYAHSGSLYGRIAAIAEQHRNVLLLLLYALCWVLLFFCHSFAFNERSFRIPLVILSVPLLSSLRQHAVFLYLRYAPQAYCAVLTSGCCPLFPRVVFPGSASPAGVRQGSSAFRLFFLLLLGSSLSRTVSQTPCSSICQALFTILRILGFRKRKVYKWAWLGFPNCSIAANASRHENARA